MTKFNIYGSCVTRDAFRAMGIGTSVERFIPRMSLHSWITPPLHESMIPDSLKAKTNWRHYRVYDDFVKDGLDFENMDYLIIDFCQELDLKILEINGSYITKSSEFDTTELPGYFRNLQEPFERGSQQEQEHWIKACHVFKERLGKHKTKIILHCAYAAYGYYDKSGNLKAFDLDIQDGNNRLVFYYATFNKIVKPHHIVAVPTEYMVADENHVWSLYPVHYIIPYYEQFYSQLRKIEGIELPEPGSARLVKLDLESDTE